MTDRQHVFVTGCARSGTTALTTLLNCHPDVAIGYERFHSKLNDAEFGPELYDSDRFCRFENGDSHYKNYNENPRGKSVLKKYHSAKFVGDKLPRLISKTEKLSGFPKAKLIVVLREPCAVARSHEVRAKNRMADDVNTGGFEDAVQVFNEVVQKVVALQEAKTIDMFVVLYEQLFFAHNGLVELFNFVGADPLRLKNIDDVIATTSKLRKLGRMPLVDHYVAMNADYNSYRTAVGNTLSADHTISNIRSENLI